MTIRRKTQVYLGITMLMLLLFLDLTFTGLLRASADKTDRERLLASLSGTSAAITAEADSLSDIADNWSHSDDTYRYMTIQDHAYVKQILNKDIITEIGISSLILINKDREVILFKDFSPHDMPSTPESEFDAICRDKKKLWELFEQNKNGISGVTLKEDRPVLFTLKPVLPSDRAGEPAGWLIATKAIDRRITDKIAASLGFGFTITPATEAEINAKELVSTEIKPSDKGSSYISGKLLIRDHLGRPAFWISGKTEKYDIYVVEKKIQKFFLLFALAAIVIAFLLDFVTNRLLYKRINRLTGEIREMRKKGEKSSVATDRSDDEISELESGLNDLVDYITYTKDREETKSLEELARQKELTKKFEMLFLETIEAVATTLTPGDSYFKASLLRAAEMTRKFALRAGMTKNEADKAYYGALFSRIGLIALPPEIRNKTAEYTCQEQLQFRKYPLESQDIIKNIPALSDSFEIPAAWNENWDGTGFPNGIEQTMIPLSARIYAIVDMWNELTRSWPGRKMLKTEEVEQKLRQKKGTRLDPSLTETFIEIIKKEEYNNNG